MTLLVTAPLSVGDLLDRVTILQLKTVNLVDPKAVDAAESELRQLEAIVDAQLRNYIGSRLPDLMMSLFATNAQLWALEDESRSHLKLEDFCKDSPTAGEQWRRTAIHHHKSIRALNDTRARIKRAINDLTQSDIVEQKSYI